MLTILVSLLGGLGLFIAGMYMMSHGIEKVAGAKLRSILETCTHNRLTGLLVGLFFTAVIQSSSTATVMAVTFVNSGLMALNNACGIILTRTSVPPSPRSSSPSASPRSHRSSCSRVP